MHSAEAWRSGRKRRSKSTSGRSSRSSGRSRCSWAMGLCGSTSATATPTRRRRPPLACKNGDLIGLPWRVAMAAEPGWYLAATRSGRSRTRSPSVRDRPTKAHEYLFLLTKRQQYHYDADAIREPCTSTGGACFGKQRHSTEGTGAQSRRLKSPAERNHPLGKNKRSVWKIPVRSYPGAHFAVFPAELVRPCILAGCPKGETVLDPFAGTGTVGAVAEGLDRDAVLIELNPVYVDMQRGRNALNRVLQEKEASPQEKAEGWLF
ncbi:MAG: site-specific DNA-methyltransferase [Gemmataceae bacterium]